MYDIIIRDATMVQGGKRRVADVAIVEGRIAYVGGQPGGPAREEINAIGRFLIPGMIDADICLQGPDGLDGRLVERQLRASFNQGLTTLVHRPVGRPRPDDLLAFDRIAAAWPDQLHSWATVDPDDPGPALDRVAAGRAVGLSVEVGADGASLERLGRLHEMGEGLLAVQAEDPALEVAARRTLDGREPADGNELHPPQAALEAARTILRLARSSRRPMLVHRLSTAGEFGLYDVHRDEIPLALGVAVPHLFLASESLAGPAALYRVDPPVRPEQDRRALWAAIKRGRLDLCVSAGRPVSQADKTGPYRQVPSGVPNAEALPGLMLGAVKNARLSMERMVQLCCEAPARVLGLTDRGRIAEGARADLLLFAEGETRRLAAGDLEVIPDWSPYLGREVGASPMAVLVAGRVVARHGRPQAP